MSTLHIVSHSPFGDDRLASCLRLLSPGDGLLLCGDAVYALTPGSAPRQSLEQRGDGVALHALQEDLLARAIELPPGVAEALDYPGFVSLCTRHDKVNTWL